MAVDRITKVDKAFLADDGAKRGPLTMSRVLFHPRERRLAAACADRRIAVFDLDASADHEVRGKGKHVLARLCCPHETGWVRAIAFHPGGEWLATGGSDRTLRLWKWEAGRPAEEPTRRIAAHDGWVEGAAFSPDGAWLVTCGADKRVRVWNAQDLAPVRTLEGHKQFVLDVLFSPQGDWFATGGEDGLVIVWDRESLEPRQTLQFGEVNNQSGQTPRASGVHRLAVSHDGRLLAAAGAQKVDFYQSASGLLVASEKLSLDAAFHPRESLFVGGESEVKGWRYETDKLIPSGKDKTVKPMAANGLPGKAIAGLKRGDWSLGLQFSPDGSHLALGKSDGTVELHEIH